MLLLNCPFASVVRTVLQQVIPARSQHKLAVLGGQQVSPPPPLPTPPQTAAGGGTRLVWVVTERCRTTWRRNLILESHTLTGGREQD